MHGNEPLGINLVEQLQQQPIKNVDAIIANSEALAANTRFTGQDLNRSFPGNQTSKKYEPKRANELTELCKQYDIVLDFHNTYCPENDCAFVGELATDILYDTASYLGLKRVIVADYDCINKYAPNCLSVEVSMDSPDNTAVLWLNKISTLSRLAVLPRTDNIVMYRFVYRMTLDDRDRFNLADQNLQAFQAVDPQLANAMGVNDPAYPIFVGDKFTQYNYGGLLERIGEPIT